MRPTSRQDIHGEISHLGKQLKKLENLLSHERSVSLPGSFREETNAIIAELSHVLVSSDATLPGIAHIVLNYSKALTKSEIGYVSSIDQVTGNNLCHTLTGLIGGSCKITERSKSIVFPLDLNGKYPGLWGHSLNAKKAFFTNDPASHPASIGLPDHHFRIRNFISVPAMFNGEVLGQISLANTIDGYSDEYLESLQRIASLYSLSIHRHNSEIFLQEERDKRRKLEKQISEESIRQKYRYENLDEAHKALELLLEQRGNQQKETEESVLRNVHNLISPYLEKFEKTALDERQRVYLNIIKSNIDDIISPFLTKTKTMEIYLTPQEMQVAALIRSGQQTKDIADILALSINSVNFHRKNIRSKFGLTNKSINLRSFLLSFSE